MTDLLCRARPPVKRHLLSLLRFVCPTLTFVLLCLMHHLLEGDFVLKSNPGRRDDLEVTKHADDVERTILYPMSLDTESDILF